MFHSLLQRCGFFCLSLLVLSHAQAGPPSAKGEAKARSRSAEGRPELPPAARACLTTGSNPFVCMAVSPDGKWLASGGYERRITIWDLASGTIVRHWDGAERNLSSLAFSPNGRLLASGGVADQ